MIELCLMLMSVQILMGAFDTIYHHELTVALPCTPGARKELWIHSVRSLLYGVLFLALALGQWQGWFAALIASVLLVEVLLTLWDFVIEDQSRLLPASERVTHTLLAINGGAFSLLLIGTLLDWSAQPSQVVPAWYGWLSVWLVLGAVGVSLSGLRDGLAAWALRRLAEPERLHFGSAHLRMLITGGSGFIGSALVRAALAAGHEVTIISRNPRATAQQFAGQVRVFESCVALHSEERFDAVINLAGANVATLPWTTARRKVLLASRLHGSTDLLAFCQRATQQPELWIQASAVGFYPMHAVSPLDEASPSGAHFAAQLCQQWEAVTAEVCKLGIRTVTLRLGLVFGPSGGLFPKLSLATRLSGGAVLGSGTQKVAWIHLEDVLQLLARALRDREMRGVYNAVAPQSPNYREFVQALGHELHRPVLWRVPAAPLRWCLGELAELLVQGATIAPQRLLALHHEFRFPTLRAALMDLS